MPENISWKRVFVEGLVIVISILLAFGIEAWWQEHGDRSAERQALMGLQSEFTEIRRRLLEDNLYQSEFAAIKELHDRAQALPLNDGTLMVADRTLARAIGAVTFEGETPILSGLISSGALEVVRDQQVRADIMEWQHWLTQLDELEQEAKTYTNTQLRPALVSRGDVTLAFLAARSFGHFQDLDGVTSLTVDSELKALLAGRLGYAGGMMEVRQRFLVTIAGDLLEAIENALEA